MEQTVFYSWQSDLPGNTNRNFIKTALEKAIHAIRQDSTIEDAPRIDHDTAGEAGSPDIVQTIFNKIDQCAVFVCDVSFINSGETTRLTPNPNVLIELGYAIKMLGWERIILVFNNAYGDVKELPFDLKTKRAMPYNITAEASVKSEERSTLQKNLEEALRLILNKIESRVATPLTVPPSDAQLAISAIEDASNKRVKYINNYKRWLLDSIVSMRPTCEDDADKSEQNLLASIKQSLPMSVDFARLVEAIAQMNDEEGADLIHDIFSPMIENCDPAKDAQGSYYKFGSDFDRFIAHEYFVTFVGCLLKMKRWPLLAKMLETPFYVHNRWRGQAQSVSFVDIQQEVTFFESRYQGQSQPAPVHSDVLSNRHADSNLAQYMPMTVFADADILLFIRSGCDEQKSAGYSNYWVPACQKYISTRVPQFLVEACRKTFARQLMLVLDVDDLVNLQTLLANLLPKLRDRNGSSRLRWVGTDFRVEQLGTK